ncbi:hypothetical protein Tco_0787240 [Tanacetum coccineum]
MGDKNPIRTLGDYSRPSHEGYRNTIKLPNGNNVVPLQSNTIRLVQNECSFHDLWFEDPNQHLKDFLKLVDSLDLVVANRERTRLLEYEHVVLASTYHRETATIIRKPARMEFRRMSLTGFIAALAVLITGASQSRQNGKSEWPLDIQLMSKHVDTVLMDK